MAAVCAWCDAPRQPGPVCPGCGADYVKAEAIRKTGKAVPASEPSHETAAPEIPASFESAEPSIPVMDPAFERSLCLFAMPAMLSIALFVQITGFLSGMQRIFFAMPIHELGHAVTGWRACKRMVNGVLFHP